MWQACLPCHSELTSWRVSLSLPRICAYPLSPSGHLYSSLQIPYNRSRPEGRLLNFDQIPDGGDDVWVHLRRCCLCAQLTGSGHAFQCTVPCLVRSLTGWVVPPNIDRKPVPSVYPCTHSHSDTDMLSHSLRHITPLLDGSWTCNVFVDVCLVQELRRRQ
jgi:hypothetical protein